MKYELVVLELGDEEIMSLTTKRAFKKGYTILPSVPFEGEKAFISMHRHQILTALAKIFLPLGRYVINHCVRQAANEAFLYAMGDGTTVVIKSARRVQRRFSIRVLGYSAVGGSSRNLTRRHRSPERESARSSTTLPSFFRRSCSV